MKVSKIHANIIILFILQPFLINVWLVHVLYLYGLLGKLNEHERHSSSPVIFVVVLKSQTRQYMYMNCSIMTRSLPERQLESAILDFCFLFQTKAKSSNDEVDSLDDLARRHVGEEMRGDSCNQEHERVYVTV